MVLPVFVTNAPVGKADPGSWRGRSGCCWEGQMIGMLEASAHPFYATETMFDLDESLRVPWVLPPVSGS